MNDRWSQLTTNVGIDSRADSCRPALFASVAAIAG
jgi:hypothetical protein